MDVFQNAIILSFANVRDIANLRRASRFFWPLCNQIERCIFKQQSFYYSYPWIASATLYCLHLIDVEFTDADFFKIRHCHLTEFKLLHDNIEDIHVHLFSDGLLALAANSPNMKSWTIDSIWIYLGRNVGAMMLQNWSELTDLVLLCDGVDAALCAQLSSSTLERLSLYITGYAEDTYPSLNKFISTPSCLIELNLRFQNIHFEFGLWGMHPRLTRLCLDNIFRITDTVFVSMAKHTPQLKHLTYKPRIHAITSLKPFSSWKCLESFSVNFGVSGLHALFKLCPKLHHIKMGYDD